MWIKKAIQLCHIHQKGWTKLPGGHCRNSPPNTEDGSGEDGDLRVENHSSASTNVDCGTIPRAYKTRKTSWMQNIFLSNRFNRRKNLGPTLESMSMLNDIHMLNCIFSHQMSSFRPHYSRFSLLNLIFCKEKHKWKAGGSKIYALKLYLDTLLNTSAQSFDHKFWCLRSLVFLEKSKMTSYDKIVKIKHCEVIF